MAEVTELSPDNLTTSLPDPELTLSEKLQLVFIAIVLTLLVSTHLVAQMGSSGLKQKSFIGNHAIIAFKGCC